MTILNDDQARLLEAYCDALAHDPETAPPDDLDPEFAAVARHLAARTAPGAGGQHPRRRPRATLRAPDARDGARRLADGDMDG